MTARYWLRITNHPWIEVSIAEFADAERACGFTNLTGGPTATAGFGHGIISGRVDYVDDTPEDVIMPLIGLGSTAAKVEGK